jgi:hypothetical protein
MVAQWIVSAGTLGSLILGFLRLRKGQREIHVMVNSTLHAAIDRGLQLEKVLADKGIAIPEKSADG